MGISLRFFNGLLLVLMALTIDSCVHELPFPDTEPGNNNPPSTPPTTSVFCSSDTVYFQQTILPLVTTLCGKSGCHGTANRKEFQLVFNDASSSYNAIRSRFVSTSNPTSFARLTSTLNEMAGKNEPGFVAPTSLQLTTLQTWIAQGSKNNNCAGCDTTKFEYNANIKVILSTFCVSCHPSPGSSKIPNLTTATAIQSEVTNFPGRFLGAIMHVAPYNTEVTKMPQGRAKLPDCYIKQIKKWVEAGAPNN
jgi:hypothetical protein